MAWQYMPVFWLPDFRCMICRAPGVFFVVKERTMKDYYLLSKEQVLEELEEELLPFTNLLVNHDKNIVYEHRFDKIFSVQM